jgi:hypothetical protein
VIFTLITPVLFFLVFGLNSTYAGQREGSGNVSAAIMILIALYGAAPPVALPFRSSERSAGAASSGSPRYGRRRMWR